MFFKRLLMGLGATCCAFFSQPALGQSGTTLTFVPIADGVEGEIKVFGGATPVGGDWSSIFVALMPPESGLKTCTATKVGSIALLTAAHCVDQGDDDNGMLRPLRSISIQAFPGATDLLVFECKIDPSYADLTYSVADPRGGSDFALCRLTKGTGSALATFTAFPIEKIDLAPLAAESPALLTGYGCVSMDVDLAGGQIKVPPFTPVFNIGDERVTPQGKVLKSVSAGLKEPALCKGDSGGPLFSGASVARPNAARAVRGVNSRVSAASGDLVSTMAALASPEFRRFANCWQQITGQEVAISDRAQLLPCAEKPVP